VPLSENFYRIAFLVIMLVTMVVAGYHRIKANRGGKVSRAGEGIALFLAIRLSGVAMFASAILYLAGFYQNRPSWIEWSKLPLPEVVRLAGAAVGLLNAAFLGWTLHTLGKNLTDTTATRTDATLVTNGPYRYVRHPFYVAMLGLALSLSLLSATWVLAASGLSTFIFLLVRAPIEERSLVEKFGEPYIAYRKRTGAVFPKLW
jgi:protein-S-isoprenylcysteine O-methyltransferase Ste14